MTEERLTKRKHLTGEYECNVNDDFCMAHSEKGGCCFCPQQEKIKQKLGEYEVLESKGMLWKLPVPEGTMIYEIGPCRCGEYYEPSCKSLRNKSTRKKKAIYVQKIRVDYHRVYCMKIWQRPFSPEKHMSRIGKNVFFEYEEALAAVKRKVKVDHGTID